MSCVYYMHTIQDQIRELLHFSLYLGQEWDSRDDTKKQSMKHKAHAGYMSLAYKPPASRVRLPYYILDNWPFYQQFQNLYNNYNF